MRLLLLTTIILTMLAQPVWAEDYNCKIEYSAKVSNGMISNDPKDPEQISLQIAGDGLQLYFQMDDGLIWGSEAELNNEYEMRSEEFWLDKETLTLNFIVRGNPNSSTAISWYSCLQVTG